MTKTHIIILIAALSFSASQSFAYDSAAAVAYAEQWWNDRNSSGPDICDPYKDYGDYDCANFVSQCLIAGGLDLSGHPGADSCGCIPTCTNIHDYLVNHLGATWETRPKGQVEPTWFLPGDPAIFGYSDAHPRTHAVFAVTGDATHYATCNAHSADANHITIQEFYDDSNAHYPNPFDRCTYYHIPTVYAGTSNPGIVYQYAGGNNWEPISPTSSPEVVNIESPHPYPNDYNNTWTETRSGAAAIRVHFTYIRTESDYDYVYVKDSGGNIINDYSGSYTDEWSDWVLGDTIKIQLISDYSVVDDGFVIDRLEWASEIPLGYAVLDLKEYNGQLYAGTTSQFSSGGIGQVYKYEGGTQWTLVGDNLDNEVCALAIYQGELYAGTAWEGMRLYKYTPGDTNCGIPDWTRVVDYSDWSGTRCLYISHGYLLMGDIGYDRFGRWDGSNFHPDLDSDGSCVYDYQDYGGYVYAAAYEGRMWQSTNAINWDWVLDYDYGLGNMWALETFQGLLYMSYDNGELRATDGGTDLRGTLKYTAPDGIISMTTDTGGRNLYFGTGGNAIDYGGDSEGIANIYRYDGNDAKLICQEDEFGAGVQVLYIAEEPPPRFNLTFPLPEIHAYNARITVVFDHSMIDNYCPDDKMVTFSGEETTQKTSYPPIDPIGCGPLYSFSKPDGSAFLVGKVNYIGSGEEENNFVLQYDAHPGYDYPDDLGTPVLAAANGYLSVIDENSGYVKIIHDGIGAGYETRYLHLNSHINSGWVARRQVIGEVGHKGISTGNHLHFEVRHNGIFVDPYGWEGSGIDPYTILTGTVNVRLWEISDMTDAGLYLILGSPADMVVRDPDGLCISKDLNQISRAAYDEIDIDGDGDLEKRVSIIDKKVGEYLIDVIPESNALPTDTYSLEAMIEGQTMSLAQDVQIQDIPEEPYIFESKLNRSDFDNDGDVDFYDYAVLASRWMNTDCHYPDWCEGTDLNFKGSVDFIDLYIFAENWLWEKIPADIDIDGDVDFVDYAIFANHWMNQNCAEPNWCGGADLNKSCSVDFYDLAEFADHWLEGTSP